MSTGVQERQGYLKAHFEGHKTTVHGGRWEALWNEKYTPWDRGHSHPALAELLQEKKNLIGESFVVDPAVGKRRKTALVPGCGRGYDVLLLSAFGYDAYGLEVSETALEAAKKHQKLKEDDDEYKARDDTLGKGKVTWVSGDFFKDDFLSKAGGDGTFDLLFDHTFLSALPLDLRPQWALRLTRLLSPTGALVCMEWPSEKDPSTGGPPWALPPQVYLGHLLRPGQELQYGKDGSLIEDNLGPENRKSLERVEHYHPGKTHPSGIAEDGRVTDWVGVWKHKSVV